MRVSGFWAGASVVGRQVDVAALAVRAGGWSALQACDARALRQLGLTGRQAAAWSDAEGYDSVGQVFTLEDGAYPASLRQMHRPPAVLHVLGDTGALAPRGIGIVGTRRCTAYGRGVSRHLAHAAASAGWSVVSGLARGIDAEAHRAAAEVGVTVAVLGHGLGYTAPPSHRGLRAHLLASGGALVSTWPDDVPPRPFRFPMRNAWIAGLSEVVVVVEAGVRSGAVITARHALAEGRDVAIVPGPLGAASSRGCLELAREGAEVIADVASFVADRTGTLPWRREGWLQDVFAGASVDDVARKHGRSVADVVGALARLEVEGVVVRLPGRRYGPSGRAP